MWLVPDLSVNRGVPPGSPCTPNSAMLEGEIVAPGRVRVQGEILAVR